MKEAQATRRGPRKGVGLLDSLFGYDIFISYKRGESATYADVLYRELTEVRRFRVFMDDRALPPGIKLKRSLLRAVGRSKAFVLILSEQARHSEWVQDELERARRKRCRIIPIDRYRAFELAKGEDTFVDGLRDDRAVIDREPTPPQSTLDALEGHFDFVRRETLQRYVLTGLAAIFMALSVALSVTTYSYLKAAASARRRLALAQDTARKFARDIQEDLLPAIGTRHLRERLLDHAAELLDALRQEDPRDTETRRVNLLRLRRSAEEALESGDHSNARRLLGEARKIAQKLAQDTEGTESDLFVSHLNSFPRFRAIG